MVQKPVTVLVGLRILILFIFRKKCRHQHFVMMVQGKRAFSFLLFQSHGPLRSSMQGSDPPYMLLCSITLLYCHKNPYYKLYNAKYKFLIFSNSFLCRTYSFRKAYRNVAVFTGIDYFYLEVVVGGVERISGLRQTNVYYTLASTRVFKHLQ